jgi:hypothetical protein
MQNKSLIFNFLVYKMNFEFNNQCYCTLEKKIKLKLKFTLYRNILHFK